MGRIFGDSGDGRMASSELSNSARGAPSDDDADDAAAEDAAAADDADDDADEPASMKTECDRGTAAYGGATADAVSTSVSDATT